MITEAAPKDFRDDLLRALCTSVANLYTAVLCGNPTEYQRQIYQAMGGLRPQLYPGVMIMEMSTIFDRSKDRRRIGRFLRHHEHVYREDDGTPCGTEMRVVLESLYDGTEVIWHNASFVRVPEERI